MSTITRLLQIVTSCQFLAALALFSPMPMSAEASHAIEPQQKAPLPNPGTKAYSLKHLAAAYSFGNGLDLNYDLTISTDGHFTFQQASYEGVEAEATGRVRLAGNKLILSPSSATPEAWPAGMGLELIPISWGARLYLVPEKEMMAFVNAVNRGSEPVEQISRGTFFLREGDLDRPVAGHPELPSRYANMLLGKPLRGKVLAPATAGLWKVDLGRHNGLQPGMELCAWSPDLKQCVTVVITRVEDDCCMVQNRRRQSEALLNWKVCSRLQYD